MPNVYRAYPLNDQGRIHRPAIALENVTTDEDIVERVTQLLQGEDLSVWHGSRFVLTVRADGSVDFKPGPR